LWHNANGQNLIWNIQNDQFNPATNIAALPTTPTSWTVAGIGYFNGNASSDVLWHNTVSGQNLIWDIQNDQYDPATNITALPTPSACWTVAGIGAFGGNGASDILWHNTISGHNLIWIIQNNQYAGGAILPTTPTSWSVAGVGDFTGSGTDGILWHDASGATQ